MKIIIAKVFPEEDELLIDLHSRMKENLDYYTSLHGDTTISIYPKEDENCVVIKSLKLEDSVN